MKAYLLVAFLFGHSFTLQLDSAAGGIDVAPRFRRRLAGLFVLGILHPARPGAAGSRSGG